jgi:hypothetical protein
VGALAQIITAISDNVVAMLAAAAYPPLTPRVDGSVGAILVGTEALFEQAAPPRIIFEPKGSKFSQREYYSASNAIVTVERQREAAMRTIASEDVMFDVRCWGAANTGNPVDDYDVTRALYHAVRASIHAVMPGAYEIEEAGKYTVGTNNVRDGREFVFGVTFLTPVLDALLPYDAVNNSAAQNAALVTRLKAPAGVVPAGNDFLTIPTSGPKTGPTEQGC